MKFVFNRDANHTKGFYKQRALNNNPIEKHMLKFAPVTYLLIIINIIIWLSMVLLLNRFSDLKLLDVGVLYILMLYTENGTDSLHPYFTL